LLAASAAELVVLEEAFSSALSVLPTDAMGGGLLFLFGESLLTTVNMSLWLKLPFSALATAVGSKHESFRLDLERQRTAAKTTAAVRMMPPKAPAATTCNGRGPARARKDVYVSKSG